VSILSACASVFWSRLKTLEVDIYLDHWRWPNVWWRPFIGVVSMQVGPLCLDADWRTPWVGPLCLDADWRTPWRDWWDAGLCGIQYEEPRPFRLLTLPSAPDSVQARLDRYVKEEE